MSNINTSGINVNYPVPGVNNSSQGFRDNFASIKINLDTAYNELTDLQNKVIVKTALANTTLNNDMANTLISNALVKNFRASTYNLGSSLSGIVTVDVSLGDVQYGTVVANSEFQFGKWAPSGTQSNVQLVLTVTNNAYISFPNNVTISSQSTLENFTFSGSSAIIKMPAGLDSVEYCYRLSTLDCGNTITIEPYNHPRVARQIQPRSLSPIGFPGDMTGAVAVDNSVTSLEITQTFANGAIQSATSVSQLYPDLQISFGGVDFGGLSNTATYYVTSANTTTDTFSVSTTPGGPNVALATATGLMTLNAASYLYVCVADYGGANVSTTASNTTAVTNTITLASTAGLTLNSPVIFEPTDPLIGSTFGGLSSNTVYYIKSIVGSTITVSRSRVNGIAGTVIPLTTANSTAAGSTMTVTAFTGPDIWKRVPLTNW